MASRMQEVNKEKKTDLVERYLSVPQTGLFIILLL